MTENIQAPIQAIEQPRNVAFAEFNTQYYDDIVSQNVEKHYVPQSVDIEKYPGIKIPDSYISYQRLVNTTLSPKGISSMGTGVMIAEAIRDFTVGGYFDIDFKAGKMKEEEKQVMVSNIKSNINKAVYIAELFGTSCMVRTFVNNKTKVEILSPGQFWYDEDKNEFYSVTPAIVDGKDGYKYERRYIGKLNGEPVTRSKVFYKVGAGTGQTRRTTNTTFEVTEELIGEPEGLGITLFTHNPYNNDWVGVSCLDQVLYQLQALELSVHEYTKAMYFTKPRALMLSDAVQRNEDGSTELDLTTDVFVEIDAAALEDPKHIMETTQFKFDAQAFKTKIGDDLTLILSKVGLDTRILAFSSDSNRIEKTATQIASEDSRMSSTIEARREEYAPKLKNLAHLIDPEIDLADFTVTFIPLHYLNFSAMTTNVTALKNSGLISDETALRMIHPRWNDKQIKEELNKLTKEKETNNGTINNGEQNGLNGTVQQQPTDTGTNSSGDGTNSGTNSTSGDNGNTSGGSSNGNGNSSGTSN